MQNDKKKQYKISKGETKLSLLVNAIFLEKQENQSTIQTRAAGWNKDHLEKKKVMIYQQCFLQGEHICLLCN